MSPVLQEKLQLLSRKWGKREECSPGKAGHGLLSTKRWAALWDSQDPPISQHQLLIKKNVQLASNTAIFTL